MATTRPHARGLSSGRDGSEGAKCGPHRAPTRASRRRLGFSEMTGSAGRASSVAVASLVASQLAHTAAAEATRRQPRARRQAVTVDGGAGRHWTPIVSQFFGSRPLGPFGWLIVLGRATSGAAVGAIRVRRLQGLAQLLDRAQTAAVHRAPLRQSEAIEGRMPWQPRPPNPWPLHRRPRRRRPWHPPRRAGDRTAIERPRRRRPSRSTSRHSNRPPFRSQTGLGREGPSCTR